MLKQCQRLGDFEIIRLLGRGGMGEVYEARQSNPDRLVALKVLNAKLADDEQALERFWREAAVPANLDHHGIVRIISTGKTPDGIAYYTMHLVRGISLADLIEQAKTVPMPGTVSQLARGADTPTQDMPVEKGASPRRPPSPHVEPGPMLQQYQNDRFGTVACIGAQAARALAYAHEQGFLHRDIKPSNLMVDRHNQVHLVDFGLTRGLGPDGNGTQWGFVPGTAWYMSPEQAEGKTLEPYSDIYSLGVTLYVLATQGVGPFTADRRNTQAVLAQVRAGEVLPLRVLAPDIPKALERIILRAMDHRPENRYANAAALADDLEQFVRQPATDRSQPAPTQRTGRKRLLQGAGGLVLLVGLSVGSYCLFNNWPTKDIIGNAPMPDTPKSGGSSDPILPKPVANQNQDDPGKKNLGPNQVKDFSGRERPLRTKINLLRDDLQPVMYKQLLAPGKFQAWGNELVFHSPVTEPQRPALLALDDPGKLNFEFTVELKAFDQNEEDTNDLGVFFGWQLRLPDPVERWRFFAVQLERRPVLGDRNGRLKVGTWHYEDAMGPRQGVHEQRIRVLPGRGIIALPAPQDNLESWHQVSIRVVNDKVTVGLAKGSSVEFDLQWIREKDRGIKNFSLNPHGALGIWARNGRGSFRNATLTALPESQ
jgi:serine/threonine protein kinase